MARQAVLKPKDRIGKWELISPLGIGGQGEVWLAKTGRRHSPTRALKVCFAEDAQARSRFEREVALMTSINHAHILSVLESSVTWSRHERSGREHSFIVLEKCKSLDQLASSTEMNVQQRMSRFLEACSGVEALHNQSTPIIHRDIKPSNLMVSEEYGRLLVGDLGIAHIDQPENPLTQTNEVVGSFGYRAPESQHGSPATPQMDVYSLGCVLGWLLTGQAPNRGPVRIARGQDLSEAACQALENVVLKATSVDPLRRPASVPELRALVPSLHLDVIRSAEPADPTPAVALVGSSPFAWYGNTKDVITDGDWTRLRQLQREARDQWFSSLTSIRRQYEAKPVITRDDLPQLSMEVLKATAPLLSFCLAVREKMPPGSWRLDQLLGEATKPPGWQRNGLTILVEMPEFILFLGHWTLGALDLEQGELKRAIEIARTRISLPSNRDSPEPVYLSSRLTFGVGLVDRNFGLAWDQLRSCHSLVDGVQHLFGGLDDWTKQLGAYSFLLSVLDYDDQLAQIQVKGPETVLGLKPRVALLSMLEDDEHIADGFGRLRSRLDANTGLFSQPSEDLEKYWSSWVYQLSQLKWPKDRWSDRLPRSMDTLFG